MIKVENLTYGVPSKDLYNEISFELETGQHAALIGSNGTGKTTLVDLIIHPENYVYDGSIERGEDCRIGYASQFVVRDKLQEKTVFEFLSQRFLDVQDEIAAVCDEMATAEDMDAAFEKYQALLDLNEAMDGDNYEANILKQLYIAGMTDLRDTMLAELSGGEYKLLQIMREMLLSPNLLVLDEPDVFLDFGNIGSLCQMINNYPGTMIVITHSRYLMNHCFDKILHLENAELNEFEGSYMEYRCWLLREKLEQKLQHMEEQEEIARTERMVEILRKRASIMANPTIGRSVNAKQTQLDRLIKRSMREPFIEIREPDLTLPTVSGADDGGFAKSPDAPGEAGEPKTVLTVSDYAVSFDECLLENVSFEIKAGEKVAIVGANGTGKTTMIQDIIRGENPAIQIDSDTKYECLSQLQAEAFDEDATIYRVMLDEGYGNEEKMYRHLKKYCLEKLDLKQKIRQLSGGELNLFQLALMEGKEADLLIFDEPTSHLDIQAQAAFEQALSEYPGTVLIVSHDFYLIANCADYVLFLEDNTVRRMRSRTFRKMVYDKYFDSSYLEEDRRKQELEAEITQAYKKNDLAAVERLCEKLEI